MAKPAVSIILPVRDEEANLREAVESLAAQSSPEDVPVDLPFEIIVVDDGSTDGTAEILSELAARIPNLVAAEAGELPDGWIGKNHACWQGAALARGGWLLFTDADVRHSPYAVREGLIKAQEHRADLVSFSPEQEMRAWWERAVIPRIFLELAKVYPYEKVNDPLDPLAAANGQWLLVSRQAYKRAGGHRAVRRKIVEDVALAEKVKRDGGRIHFAPGAGLARTRMYRRFGEMWRGWTKNLNLLLDPRPGRMALLYLPALFPLTLLTLAYWNLWLGLVGAAGLAAAHFGFALKLRRQGVSPRLAAFYLPGLLLFAALVVSSWFRRRVRKQVSWKGRSYKVTGRNH